MLFEQAITILKQSPKNKVRRKCWDENCYYFLSVNNWLMMVRHGYIASDFTVDYDDVMADDWEKTE